MKEPGYRSRCRDWARGWTVRGLSPCRAESFERFLSSPKRPHRLWGPPSLLFNGYRCSFPGVRRPGREADHLSPLAYRYFSIRSLCFSLKMDPIRCPETSVNNCHTMLRNIAKERRSAYTIFALGPLLLRDETDLTYFKMLLLTECFILN
jgi:hypothetical protein